MTDEQLIEPSPPPVKKTSWASIGILFSTLGLLVMIIAFSIGYFQMAKVTLYLAEQISQLQTSMDEEKLKVASVETLTHSLQQSLDKTEKLSQQQEQLLTEWRTAQQGNLEKWHLAEAFYLTKLANDHLQFTHNLKFALLLLNRANQVLGSMNEASILELRKSLSADIAKIQGTPEVDVTQVYLRLTGLEQQIDQLTLPFNPLEPSKEEALPPQSSNAPWWKVGIDQTWSALSKIVIVRNTGTQSLPLIMPEEKMFLLQNLHAQIQQAISALLERNQTIYQTSLERMREWIQKYFAQDAASTKAMLTSLQELKSMDIQLPTLDLANSLKLFDDYFAQNAQNAPVHVEQ